MKKYNSFLGAFFSGDSGQGGYNAAYGKSALAKLYSSQDPAEQQMAAEGLARVDPESAGKWQQEQAKVSQQRLEQKARMLASLPSIEQKQSLYASMLPEVRKSWADAPEQYTPDLDQALSAWAGGSGGQGATPSDVQSFDYFAQGMTAEEKEKARRIKLGLDQKVGAEGIKYLPNGGAAYEDPVSKKVYIINPGETSWREFSYPTAMGGKTQETEAPTPETDYNAIATNLQKVLRDAGFDETAAQDVATAYHERMKGKPKGQYTDGVNPLKPKDEARVAEQQASSGWADTSKPKEDKVETWSQPTSVIKNGKPVMIQTSNQGNERERPDLAPADSTKAPTQDQSNAAGFYSRMQQSERIIAQIEAEGYSPAANKGDYFSAGGTFTNWATSPKGQKYYNAATNWIRANLRKESGAAIGVDEAKQEYSTYFPIPGDTKETIEQKRQLRQQTIEAVRGAGMPAMKYQDNQNQRAPAGKANDPLGILK